MSHKSFVAIDLEDFHDKKKAWQGAGKDGDHSVKIRLVGGKNLEQAKRTAAYGNTNAWYVFPMGTLRNMVWAVVSTLNKEACKARGC